MIYKASWSHRFEVKPDRWVYNPTSESGESGQQINKLLNKSWKKPSYYYHLRNGGHVEAIKIHLEHRYFATIDISDFFKTISRSRIRRALKPIVGYENARKSQSFLRLKPVKTILIVTIYPMVLTSLQYSHRFACLLVHWVYI